MTTQDSAPKTKTQKNREYYEKAKANVFSLRLSNDTTELFNEMCSTTDKGKSELIRAILEGATIRTPNPKVTDDVLRELSAIGNNINQLARLNNEAKANGVQLHGIALKIDEFKTQLKELSDKL